MKADRYERCVFDGDEVIGLEICGGRELRDQRRGFWEGVQYWVAPSQSRMSEFRFWKSLIE